MGGELEGGFNCPAKVFQLPQCINTLFLLGVIIFPLAFGACSSERRGGEAGRLEERVKEFWEARIAGNDLKAYNYEAYSKTGKMTLQKYLRARSPLLKYKTYEVKKAVENGDEALVTVDFIYHLIVPARADLDLSTIIDERWVRIDGQWYRELEKPETSQATN